MSNGQHDRDSRTRGHAPLAMALGAGVLIGMLLREAGPGPAAYAGEAPSERAPMGVPNGAEQRARMIEALGKIDQRLQRVESALTSGQLKVRVVEMPAAAKGE